VFYAIVSGHFQKGSLFLGIIVKLDEDLAPFPVIHQFEASVKVFIVSIEHDSPCF
jgi:hypothetical protein